MRVLKKSVGLNGNILDKIQNRYVRLNTQKDETNHLKIKNTLHRKEEANIKTIDDSDVVSLKLKL